MVGKTQISQFDNLLYQTISVVKDTASAGKSSCLKGSCKIFKFLNFCLKTHKRELIHFLKITMPQDSLTEAILSAIFAQLHE